MKAKFSILALLIFVFCFSMATPNQAQTVDDVVNLFGKKKKKKKKGNETQATETKTESKAQLPIKPDDPEKSKKLVKAFYPLLKTPVFLMKNEKTVPIKFQPADLAKEINEFIKDVKTISNPEITAFYEANKADIDRYVKTTEMLNSLRSVPERRAAIEAIGASPSEVEKHIADSWDMERYKRNGSWRDSWSNDYRPYKGASLLDQYNNYPENMKIYLDTLWNGEFYENKMESGIKIATEFIINTAYKKQDTDKAGVIKMLMANNALMETFKKMMPQDAAYKSDVEKWDKDLKAAIKDIAGDYLAGLYASDFHEANVGKILFSKKPIDPKTATAADFTTDFTINDPIYAVIFLDTKLKFYNRDERQYKMARTNGRKDYDEGKQIYIEPHLDFSVKLDDNKYIAVKQFGSEDEIKAKAEQAYIAFALKPAELKATRADAFVDFAKYISQKSPRTHEITFEMIDPTVKYGKPIANGKLSISLLGMDKQKLTAQAQKAESDLFAAQQEMILTARGLPDAFSNPALYSHSFKPVSFAQVKALITRNLKAGYGAAKVDAIVVQNENSKNKSTWEVKVNVFGVPLSRSGPGYYVAYTGTDGKCYHYYFYIFQKYQGGGYGATTNGTPSGITPTEYNCEKKKFAK